MDTAEFWYTLVLGGTIYWFLEKVFGVVKQVLKEITGWRGE